MKDVIIVLNLIITGIPSIWSILPYRLCMVWWVLNLIITGIPSILLGIFGAIAFWSFVLNLIITGIPSILRVLNENRKEMKRRFKPCYKWNAFNTLYLLFFKTEKLLF